MRMVVFQLAVSILLPLRRVRKAWTGTFADIEIVEILRDVSCAFRIVRTVIMMLTFSVVVGNALSSTGRVWKLLFATCTALQWQAHALSRDEGARVGGLSQYMGVAPEQEARWAARFSLWLRIPPPHIAGVASTIPVQLMYEAQQVSPRVMVS